jgi:hypothetical protein
MERLSGERATLVPASLERGIGGPAAVADHVEVLAG